jgi:hypothetical protein
VEQRYGGKLPLGCARFGSLNFSLPVFRFPTSETKSISQIFALFSLNFSYDLFASFRFISHQYFRSASEQRSTARKKFFIVFSENTSVSVLHFLRK